MNPAPATDPVPGLPLVVQMAFIGSRQVLDVAAHPGVDPVPFEAALQQQLIERLRALPADLALETEARLLGETAAWHARRAFTGIA